MLFDSEMIIESGSAIGLPVRPTLRRLVGFLWLQSIRHVSRLNDALASTNTAVAAIPGQITLVKTSDTSPITLSRGVCALIGNKIAIIDAAFDVSGTIPSNVLQSMFYFPGREFSRFSDLQCIRILSGGSTTGNIIIPFAAKNDSHRIGINGSTTSLLTANTSWYLTGIVFLK